MEYIDSIWNDVERNKDEILSSLLHVLHSSYDLGAVQKECESLLTSYMIENGGKEKASDIMRWVGQAVLDNAIFAKDKTVSDVLGTSELKFKSFSKRLYDHGVIKAEHNMDTAYRAYLCYALCKQPFTIIQEQNVHDEDANVIEDDKITDANLSSKKYVIKKHEVPNYVFWPIYIILLIISAVIPIWFAVSNDFESSETRFLGACGIIAAMGSKESLHKLLSHFSKKYLLNFLGIYGCGVAGAFFTGIFYFFLLSKGFGGLLGWVLSFILSVVTVMIFAGVVYFLVNRPFKFNLPHHRPQDNKEKETSANGEEKESVDSIEIEKETPTVDSIIQNSESPKGEQPSPQLNDDGESVSKATQDVDEHDCSSEKIHEEENENNSNKSQQDKHNESRFCSKSLGYGALLKGAIMFVVVAIIFTIAYYVAYPYYQKVEFEKAIALLKIGNNEDAEKILRSLAESGFNDAETKYGIMLINGDFNKTDLSLGEKLLLNASQEGDTLAQAKLGRYYYWIKKDVTKAFYWTKEAHANGSIEALCDLVSFYSTDDSKEYQNQDSAVFYAKLIPDKNSNKELFMGNAYSSGDHPNYTMAFYWWKRGAAKNDASCLDNLGFMYHYGNGTAKDNNVALEYFLKAIDLQPDDSYALRHLGEIYFENGELEKAKSYLQKSADLEDEDAQEELSRLELTGKIYE